MDSIRLCSQPSIFMARAPPTASPSRRTRSSVNVAVRSRSRPMSRDSVACRRDQGRVCQLKVLLHRHLGANNQPAVQQHIIGTHVVSATAGRQCQ